MKFCGATVIAACLAGTAIALPTMKGPMFTNKQVELIEMINNNRGELPLSEKTAQVLDNLMDVVRWQQAGMPSLGDAAGAASDVATAAPTATSGLLGDAAGAASDVATAAPSAASGLLGDVAGAASDVATAAPSAASGLLGEAAGAEGGDGKLTKNQMKKLLKEQQIAAKKAEKEAAKAKAAEGA
ncbi:hypothetical protein NLG97_g5827 [Lecanicillium saksenae]|uniref:Uncharacterized protein n=1 Tax=Lecanicillium saksenae TaxID=468837 RepID=A0ACC1QTR0_9HYPO|nr:hypothetical protein NLG97_g5827 [Lecanicillium saksenae]